VAQSLERLRRFVLERNAGIGKTPPVIHALNDCRNGWTSKSFK
jgi:hypothetical protein